MTNEIKQIENQYIKLISKPLQRLSNHKVFFEKDPTKVNRNKILRAQELFNSNKPKNIADEFKYAINADFGTCLSLYHGWDLLHVHGYKAFYEYLMNIVDEMKQPGKK